MVDSPLAGGLPPNHLTGGYVFMALLLAQSAFLGLRPVRTSQPLSFAHALPSAVRVALVAVSRYSLEVYVLHLLAFKWAAAQQPFWEWTGCVQLRESCSALLLGA